MREDWIETEIGDVAHLYQPKTISAKMLVTNGRYPVYGANGIIGKYDSYNHEEEELLITCRGATCGNVHITQSFSWINGNAMVVKPFKKDLLSLEYLKLVFSNKGRTQKAISGSAQPQITRTTLSPINIPLAPLPEQRAIVAKIEELFSDLDKGIDDLKKAKEQLTIYRQAVLKKAFEGELTKEWRNKQELNLKDWNLISLEKLCTKVTDGEHFKPPVQESGVYFLSAKDVRENGIDFSDPLYISQETAEKALKRCNPENGDILIVSRGATVGRMCIVKTEKVFCLLGSVILLKISDIVDSLFLTYVLKSPQHNRQLITISGSTAQQAIYLRDIKKVDINVPSKDEQYQIVKEIESRLSICEKVEQSINDSLEKAKALRQSILKKAFEGKLLSAAEIVRCKQEKDYEPAAVLLEKIKVEKKKK